MPARFLLAAESQHDAAKTWKPARARVAMRGDHAFLESRWVPARHDLSQGPRHDLTPLQRVSASTVPAAARAQWLRLAASRCLLTTDPRISTFHPLPFSAFPPLLSTFHPLPSSAFPPHPCTHTLTHMRWGLRSSTLVSTSTCLPRASPLRVSSTLPPRPWSRCRRTPRCSLLSVSGWRRTPRRPTARARRRPTAVPSSSSLPTRVARPSIGY